MFTRSFRKVSISSAGQLGYIRRANISLCISQADSLEFREFGTKHDTLPDDNRAERAARDFMKRFLQESWFLIGLLILIPGGFWWGAVLGADQIAAISRNFGAAGSKINVMLTLFLMSWTLDTRKLVAAIRAPGPVLWASSVNAGLIPLMALFAMSVQLLRDFSVGILVATSVPCTMAAASVWTRKSHGNDAVSMLVTVVTNSACFLVAPFWLSRGIGGNIQLDVYDLMSKLVITALVPILAGQLSRIPKKSQKLANDYKLPLSYLAQCCILLMVLWASVQGGPDLASGELLKSGGTVGSIALVWGTVILIHLTGLGIAWMGGSMLGFARADVAAICFASSQKTLPIGLYIVTDLLSGHNVPFAIFPVLMYHSSQMFLDTLFIGPLSQWVDGEASQDTGQNNVSADPVGG